MVSLHIGDAAIEKPIRPEEEQLRAPFLPQWFIVELGEVAARHGVSMLHVLVEGARAFDERLTSDDDSIDVPTVGRIPVASAKRIYRAIGRYYAKEHRQKKS